MTEPAKIAEMLLDAALKAGADAADAMVHRGDSISIEVRGGALEHAERAEGADAGLRVIKGAKQATIASSDLSDHGIREMAARAMAMAGVAPDDPYCALAEPGQLATAWDAGPLEIADGTEADPAQLQERALAAEAAAMAVAGISKIESAGAGWSGSDIALAATNGFAGGYRRTAWDLTAVAIAGEGLQMERDYCSEGRVFGADLPSPEQIGRIAGERTVARFGARKPPTGTFPVLYDERIAASLIGHMVPAINGSSITRGSSWLKDAMGQQVLPEGIDLWEDPLKRRGARSRPFDAEGLPVERRMVVEDGVLKSWTLDLSTARQLGLHSTANASRNPGSTPSPALGNLEMTKGTRSRADLIADMGTGLLVTSMIGATISATTGDYSRGASGFWVENGEIAYPVNECTIAGNLRDMLARIIPANDARPHLTRVVPSLLVADMTIAGA